MRAVKASSRHWRILPTRRLSRPRTVHRRQVVASRATSRNPTVARQLEYSRPVRNSRHSRKLVRSSRHSLRLVRNRSSRLVRSSSKRARRLNRSRSRVLHLRAAATNTIADALRTLPGDGRNHRPSLFHVACRILYAYCSICTACNYATLWQNLSLYRPRNRTQSIGPIAPLKASRKPLQPGNTG